MTKMYIASPLFSAAEREYNRKVKEFVESLGFQTYLPQDDGGILTELTASGMAPQEAREFLFNQDCNAIKESDIILIVLDGRVPDEGACLEIGMGFALNKECIGLKTDTRTFIDNDDNLMITGVIRGRIARNFEELSYILANLIESHK